MSWAYFKEVLRKELVGPTDSKLLFVELLATILVAYLIVTITGIVCLLTANGRLVTIVAGILLETLTIVSTGTIISRPFERLNKTKGKIRRGGEKQITEYNLKPAAKSFVAGIIAFEKTQQGYPSTQAKELMATIILLASTGMKPLSAALQVESTVRHEVTLSQNFAFPALSFENEGGAYPTYFTLRFVAGLKMRTFCADITRGEVWESQ